MKKSLKIKRIASNFYTRDQQSKINIHIHDDIDKFKVFLDKKNTCTRTQTKIILFMI